MRFIVALALVWSMSGATARADSLRCGQRIINVGERMGEVLLKCGPPTFRDRFYSDARYVEEWTYNLGPHDFIRVLTFVDGVLRAIYTGDYGQ